MRKHLSNPRSSENRFPFRYISSSSAALAKPARWVPSRAPPGSVHIFHLTTPTTAVPAPYLLRTSRLVPKPHPHHHAIVGRRNGHQTNGHHRASPRKHHTQKRPVPPETGSQTSSSYQRPHTGTPKVSNPTSFLHNTHNNINAQVIIAVALPNKIVVLDLRFRCVH